MFLLAKRIAIAATLSATLLPLAGLAIAQPPEAQELQLIEYPIAILPFRERGKEVKEMGGQVADLMFAKLVVDPSLFLVDREDLDKTLGEAELNLSGIVNPNEAVAIGQLTGAKLIGLGLSSRQHDLRGRKNHRHRNKPCGRSVGQGSCWGWP